MANIKDLFTQLPDDADINEPIDIDKVLSAATDILNDRPPVPDDNGPRTSPGSSVREVADSQLDQMRQKWTGTTDDLPDDSAPGPDDQPDDTEDLTGEEGGEEELDDEELPPTSFDQTPTPAHDPLLDLPAERRAALLALDESIMSDPDKRAKVFGILSGDSEAPVASAGPVAPSLPDHIDPDSFEATLWRENQEIKQQLAGIAQATQIQAQATAQERARAAATSAATRFGTKYAEQLTQADVVEIAQYAANAGIPGAFMNTAEAKRDPSLGFEQALEHVLWTNEAFRGRVLGAQSAPAKPPGEQPEAQNRKRKLQALSGAASPVSGPAPQRPPLEAGVDGRLTEKSRQTLIKEAATMLRQGTEG